MRFAPLALAKFADALAGRAPSGLAVCRVLCGAAILFAAATVAFAAVHRVAQQNRSFSVGEITITAGDSIVFSNDDEFLHQIYVDSDAMNFDSAEQRPGETITVTFPQAGTFPVRCHIHPKMLLTVRVK